MDCSPGVLSYERARVGTLVAQVVGVTVTAPAKESTGQVGVHQRRGCESFTQVDTPVVGGRQASME